MSNYRNYFKSGFWDIRFLIVLGFSVSVLVSAFYIDWFLGFDPCILCFYQRIPYGALSLLSVLAIVSGKKYRSYLLVCMIITLATGLGISIYHTGVERHIWESTTHCSPNISFNENLSLQEFQKQLDQAKIGDCSKPAFYVLGLSLAECNIIISFALLIYFAALLRYHFLNKHKR